MLKNFVSSLYLDLTNSLRRLITIMKIYNKKVLTTALSAGVFALGNFAAMNAYASNTCLVCWSEPAGLCQSLPKPTSPDNKVSFSSANDIQRVMWMSCYERQFRSEFNDVTGEVGRSVTENRCLNVPGNYTAPVPDNFTDEIADNAWWYEGQSCEDLKDVGIIASYIPRAADSLTYTPICLVTNDGSDYEDVDGVGNLAPGATGLLNKACPK
jgi:hypothetical protein